MRHTSFHIVHLDSATIGPSVALHRPDQPHHWTSYERTAPEEVVARLKGADIAVLNKVAITKAHLEALPDLKMIALSATGFDKIDIAACHAQGVTVSNIRDYAQDTVPEHTLAMILNLRRSISSYHASVQAGDWQASGQFCYFTYPISDLKNSVLGIIGTGSIGKGVITLAKAFGMQILQAGRKGDATPPDGYTPFDEVMRKADIITMHCPLTEETKGYIGQAEFRQMAQKPLIINVSRGGLVDEHDLITALDEGLISGAALDVLTAEPPMDDHIIMQNLHRPNLLVTPHVAWASDEAMQALWNQLVGHIEHFMKGTPRNCL